MLLNAEIRRTTVLSGTDSSTEKYCISTPESQASIRQIAGICSATVLTCTDPSSNRIHRTPVSPTEQVTIGEINAAVDISWLDAAFC